MGNQTIAILTILCISFLLLGLVGCKSKDSASPQAMTVKETLSKYHDQPVGKSIGPVVRCIARISVMTAIEDSSLSTDGNLKLRVGNDNQGRLWAYVYTDKEEFAAAFPKGGKFAEMPFPNLFAIVESDNKFGGIYINCRPEFTYLIPREMFPDVRKIIDDQ